MHVYAWIWIYRLSLLCVQLTAWGNEHRHLFMWVHVHTCVGCRWFNLAMSSHHGVVPLSLQQYHVVPAELRFFWEEFDIAHWKGNWDFRLSELMLPYFGQGNSSHDHSVSVDMKKHRWVGVKSRGYICLDTHFSDSLQVPINLHPNYTYHYAEQTDSF